MHRVHDNAAFFNGLRVQIVQTGTVLIRKLGHLWKREPLRRIGHTKLSAISAWGLPIEYLRNAGLIQAEVELGIVKAEIYILPAFRIFVDIVIGYGEQLAPLNA